MKRYAKKLLAAAVVAACLLPSAIYAGSSTTANNNQDLSVLSPIVSEQLDASAKVTKSSRAIQVYDDAELLFTLEEKVKNAILEGETSVDISSMNIGRATNNITQLKYASPYFSNGIVLNFWYSSAGTYVKISILNTMTTAETKAYFQKVENKINEIKALVSDTMSDEQKALIVHDYLAYEAEYDYDSYQANSIPADSYSSGGLLMKGKAVCQGYAYSYQYIMNLFGIECYVTASTAMNHAWNIIKIDGSYYHVDCTWDDPVYDRLGWVSHQYFLVSDERMSQSHKGWDLTSLVCDNKKYDTAYWLPVTSSIIFDGNNAYYIEGTSIYKRDLTTQKATKLKDLGVWEVWNGNGYYQASFSGLFLYKGELYYNTSKEIRKISTSGENDTSVYQPDLSNGYVYGSKKDGEALKYAISQAPYLPGENKTAPITLPDDTVIPISSVSLNKTSLSLKRGDSATLTAKINPTNTTNSKTLTWKSSNIKVVTVKSGKVTAVAPGTATITVTTSNGKTAKCKVTVKEQTIGKTTLSKPSVTDYQSLKLIWKKVSNASGYKIYRATSKNGSYKLVKTINSGSQVSYTDTKLTTGKNYYYKIKVFRKIGSYTIESDNSAVQYAKPIIKKVTISSVTNSTGRKAIIKWKKVSGASGYVIYRSTSKNGTYTAVKKVTSGSTVSYTNTGLQKGKTYYYKIRAYRTVSGKAVYGEYSSIKSIKVTK